MKQTPSILYFTAIVACVWLSAASAQAQQVYRCGNSYSQTPCANAETLEVQDARSAQEKRQMDKQTAQASQLAEQMQRERQAQEKKDLAANRPVGKPTAPRAPSPPSPPTTPRSDGINTVLQADTTPRAEKPKLFRPRKSGEFTALAPKPPKPVKPPPSSKQQKNRDN